jgi:hypothetical protein
MPRTRPTPELRHTLCSYIRSGAFPHAAAAAAGLSPALLDAWLERGERPGARDPYRTFAVEVRRAAAQARIFAELNVFRERPAVWLVNGPGKEAPARPGWTGAARPAADAEGAADALSDPRVQEAIAVLLETLEAFPDARTAVAAALAGLRGGRDE